MHARSKKAHDAKSQDAQEAGAVECRMHDNVKSVQLKDTLGSPQGSPQGSLGIPRNFGYFLKFFWYFLDF